MQKRLARKRCCCSRRGFFKAWFKSKYRGCLLDLVPCRRPTTKRADHLAKRVRAVRSRGLIEKEKDVSCQVQTIEMGMKIQKNTQSYKTNSVNDNYSREGNQGFDSRPEHTGWKGQIYHQKIHVSVRSQKLNSESLVSTGREPQVLLCMAQAGARSTQVVVSAASMGLE